MQVEGGLSERYRSGAEAGLYVTMAAQCVFGWLYERSEVRVGDVGVRLNEGGREWSLLASLFVYTLNRLGVGLI